MNLGHQFGKIKGNRGAHNELRIRSVSISWSQVPPTLKVLKAKEHYALQFFADVLSGRYCSLSYAVVSV